MEHEKETVIASDYADGGEEERKATGEGDVGRDEKGRSSEEELATAIAKERFLAGYKLGISVSKAAHMAGVDRRTIYRWRDRDREFAKAWREAREGLVEDLEMEAYKRAFKGNDRLLMFLLRSYKPVTYSEGLQQGKPRRGKAKDLAELVERVRGWN